jgi:ribosomal protein S18 acetylase RimI-like enzyme
VSFDREGRGNRTIFLRTSFIGAIRGLRVTLALVPFAVDQPTSLALAGAALRTRLSPGEDLRDLLPPVESAIRSARATGGILREEGVARGMVLWEPSGPVGVAVRLLYLRPPSARVEGYSEALDLVSRAAGPVAFSVGPLAGLTAAEEAGLMEGRGFARFGRSEMTFPSDRLPPTVPLPPGAELRAVRPEDAPELARLHEAAYRHHLDRYLALEDLDPARDADRQVKDYFSGRWGDLLVPGSMVTTFGGRPASAAIAVQRTAHALIVDVMTDPVHAGHGFARAALAASLVALRGRGESAVVLNVTEGNDRALRLYRELGFVRSMGPTIEWYDARRMPVEIPDPAPVTPMRTAPARSAGTRDEAGRGTPRP